MLAETTASSVRPTAESDNSTTHIDIALLFSMLFLQRFTLPYGATALHLDLVPMGLILVYQFLSGKLLIQYDRLLWFLAFAFASTCSLLLNLKNASVTSCSHVIVLCSFFTLR